MHVSFHSPKWSGLDTVVSICILNYKVLQKNKTPFIYLDPLFILKQTVTESRGLHTSQHAKCQTDLIWPIVTPLHSPEPLQNLCWQCRDVFSWCAKNLLKTPGLDCANSTFSSPWNPGTSWEERGRPPRCLPSLAREMDGRRIWASSTVRMAFTKGWKSTAYSWAGFPDGMWAFRWGLCFRLCREQADREHLGPARSLSPLKDFRGQVASEDSVVICIYFRTQFLQGWGDEGCHASLRDCGHKMHNRHLKS